MAERRAKGLPYSGHCRVLEAMFPGRSAHDLFATTAVEIRTQRAEPDPARSAGPDVAVTAPALADVTAVFSSRSAFSSAYPASSLFDDAKEINAAGLSLNILCQSYPDHQLKRLLDSG